MSGNFNRASILTSSSLFIAMIAVFSWVSVPIPLPFFPVPITLQTLAVLLAGIVMKRYAVFPVILYLILGALGLPVFHNGMSGLGVLFGPTGGYLIGFIPAVLIIGFGYEVGRRSVEIGSLCLATACIYLFGIGWLILSTGMAVQAALIAGMIPFLPGDLLKGIAAYLIGIRLRNYELFPLRR